MRGEPPGARPAEPLPTVEILAVGDELLIGETVNTNAAWLGRRLSALGMRVCRRAVVGDDRGEIQAAVSAALGRADVVVVTGGLGPTRDDLTKPAVAGLLGCPLRLDEELLDELKARWRRWGREEFPERNVAQAEIPEGAVAIPNTVGTAPGLVLESERRLVILLPGVPREMKALVEEGVVARIEERFADRLAPLRMRTLRTSGIPESRLAELVDDALSGEEPGPVSVAFLPELGAVDIRLSVRGDADEAERSFDRVEEVLRPVLGDGFYGHGDEDIVEVIGDILRSRGVMLAVAESCTGGMVGERITATPGASDFFLGGVIAYDDAVKEATLGVDAETLQGEGAVSEAVARRMALGACRALGADAAMAVTGIAGPAGGTEEKPVGTVWYASAVDGETLARKEVFPGGRDAVRTRSTQAVLTLLWRHLGCGRG